MFKNYGSEFNEQFDMAVLTNDLFYFGFNKQLIETLTELAKICKGKYKGITQIKLLNTISIILTLKSSHFPLSINNLKKPSAQSQPRGDGQDPSESMSQQRNNSQMRKGSDTNTYFEGGRDRKISEDTQAMEFNEGGGNPAGNTSIMRTVRDAAEVDSSMLMDEATQRYFQDRNGNHGT
jgi:hypothetical protein